MADPDDEPGDMADPRGEKPIGRSRSDRWTCSAPHAI